MYSCETQVQRKFKRAYGAYELRNRNITLLDYQVKLLDQLSSLLSLTRMSLQEDLLESRFALAEAA